MRKIKAAHPRRRGRPRSKAKAARKVTSKVEKRRKEQDIASLKPPRSLELKDLDMGLFGRGRIYKRFIRCGKDSCHCKKEGRGHGPYHYLVLPIPKHLRRWKGPKAKWFYITSEEAALWRERIANYKRLQTLVWNNMLEELDL